MVENSDGKYKYVGTIPIDVIVQANYLMEVYGIKHYMLKIENTDKTAVLQAKEAEKLIGKMYATKINELNIQEIVDEIDTEIKYHPQLAMEGILNFFDEKKIGNREKNRELVTDLLDQFKEQMEWKR